MIIGLVGSCRLQRTKVAAMSQEFSGGTGRIRIIETPLAYTDSEYFLKVACKGVGDNLDEVVIFPQVETAGEAAHIRGLGGYIWAVKGAASPLVPINKNDLMVTAEPGGDRHYHDPIEAISEQIIRHQKRKKSA